MQNIGDAPTSVSTRTGSVATCTSPGGMPAASYSSSSQGATG